MATRVVDTEADRALLLWHIAARPLPFTVDIVKGRRRSTEQNRLQMLWIKEAAEQLDDRTFEELRAECKLRFGVPILRAENEIFRERYDAIFKPLPLKTKLALMMEPFDFPVTRLMSTSQKTAYLNDLSRWFLSQGIALTEPPPVEMRRAA